MNAYLYKAKKNRGLCLVLWEPVADLRKENTQVRSSTISLKNYLNPDEVFGTTFKKRMKYLNNKVFAIGLLRVK